MGEAFSRGALLGRLTATGKWQVIDEDNVATCNDFGIAVEAVDSTAGEVNTTVYVEGEFNENGVIFSYATRRRLARAADAARHLPAQSRLDGGSLTMSIDIYSPRVMIAALREIKPVRTFLRDTFFGQAAHLPHREHRHRPAGEGPPRGAVRQPLGARQARRPPGLHHLERRAALHRDEDADHRAGRLDPRHGRARLREPRPRAARAGAARHDLAELDEMLHAPRGDDVPRRHLQLSGNNSVVTRTETTRAHDLHLRAQGGAEIGTLTARTRGPTPRQRPARRRSTSGARSTPVTGLVVTDLVFGGTAYRTFLDNAKVKAKMVNTSLIQTGVVAPAGRARRRAPGRHALRRRARMWTYHEWYDDPDNAARPRRWCRRRRSCWRRTRCAPSALRRGPGPHRRRGRTGADAGGRSALPRSWVGPQHPPVRYVELRSRPLPVPIQNHFLTAQVQA
jgi:hypothetical protein